MDIIYFYRVACYKKKCKIELIKKIYINRHKRITAGFLVVIFFFRIISKNLEFFSGHIADRSKIWENIKIVLSSFLYGLIFSIIKLSRLFLRHW